MTPKQFFDNATGTNSDMLWNFISDSYKQSGSKMSYTEYLARLSCFFDGVLEAEVNDDSNEPVEDFKFIASEFDIALGVIDGQLKSFEYKPGDTVEGRNGNIFINGKLQR